MLVTGRAPFNEANDSETLTMILDCKFIVPAHVSASCRNLITRMIVRQPDDRMSLEDVCIHEWFTTSRKVSANQLVDDDDEIDEDEDDDQLDEHTVPKHRHHHFYESIASNESSGDDNRSHRTSSSSSINRRRRGSKRSSSGDSLNRSQQQQQSPLNDATVLTNQDVPLVKRENLSEKDNKEILKLMVNGNITASEDEIVK